MNFNIKNFNRAAWITLLITYVLPYQWTDGFATKFGYPLPFLTVYKTSISNSLLKQTHSGKPSFVKGSDPWGKMVKLSKV